MKRILSRYHSPLAIFLAPDTGGASGGGEPSEPKTLADAKVKLQEAHTRVDALEKERDEAKSAAAALQAQFDAAVQAGNESKQQLDAANAKVTDLTAQVAAKQGEIDALNGKLTASAANVTRLETLCGIKGLDANQVAKPVPQTAVGESSEEIQAAIAATSDPKQKFKLAQKLEAARKKEEGA